MELNTDTGGGSCPSGSALMNLDQGVHEVGYQLREASEQLVKIQTLDGLFLEHTLRELSFPFYTQIRTSAFRERQAAVEAGASWRGVQALVCLSLQGFQSQSR
jgi:hypothetical protein